MHGQGEDLSRRAFALGHRHVAVTESHVERLPVDRQLVMHRRADAELAQPLLEPVAITRYANRVLVVDVAVAGTLARRGDAGDSGQPFVEHRRVTPAPLVETVQLRQ